MQQWADGVLQKIKALGLPCTDKQEVQIHWAEENLMDMQALDLAMMRQQARLSNANIPLELPEAIAAKWKVKAELRDPVSGYEGVLLASRSEPVKYLLLHGSTNNSIDLLHGSVQQFSNSGELDEQVKMAIEFTRECMTKTGGEPLQHYGYSLGGVLAQVGAVAQRYDGVSGGGAITVDNTGISQVLPQAIRYIAQGEYQEKLASRSEGKTKQQAEKEANAFVEKVTDRAVEWLSGNHTYFPPYPASYIATGGQHVGLGVAIGQPLEARYAHNKPDHGSPLNRLINQDVFTKAATKLFGLVFRINVFKAGSALDYLSRNRGVINDMLGGFTDYTVAAHTSFLKPSELAERLTADNMHPVALSIPEQYREKGEFTPTSLRAVQHATREVYVLPLAEAAAHAGASERLEEPEKLTTLRGQPFPHRAERVYVAFLNVLLHHVEELPLSAEVMQKLNVQSARELTQKIQGLIQHVSSSDLTHSNLETHLSALVSNFARTDPSVDQFIRDLAVHTQNWIAQVVADNPVR